MTAAFDFAYRDDLRVNGTEIPGSGFTTGIFSLSGGFTLSKDLFLSVTGGFGITDDSADATLSVAVPYRF